MVFLCIVEGRKVFKFISLKSIKHEIVVMGLAMIVLSYFVTINNSVSNLIRTNTDYVPYLKKIINNTRK